ncbi:MAG TPA: hypothetical protein VHH36_08070 [Candidatus Thermoplasmatota archaeon]|nr:hypothetical protein [Candidatus Thermoplasmatota archaeon]
MASLAVAGGAAAQGAPDNRGTIKIHDNATADPEERNEPHVSCDFYVQGFNMKDPAGHLVFTAWPPTSNKHEVTPTGDTLTWTGVPDGDGEYDFLKGAYFLPAGHYRLEVYTDDGHPGHEAGHFAKAKMFWVDPCEGEQPPCVDNPDTEADDCSPPPCVDDEQTAIDECDEVEIPFFPGFTQLALGSLGALAMVGLALRRRS